VNSELEQAYIDSLTRQVFPGPEMEVAGTVRPGAMQGEMSAIEQTTGEKVMEGIGTTLERAGQMIDQGKATELGRIFSVIDEWVPGTLNEITGKQIPIIGDMRLRDLMPFVGSTEQVQDPMTGEMITKEIGTPQAFKMAGRGESLTTGTGFTTQLKSDPKMAALELGMTVAPGIKPAVGRLAKVGREMATTPPTGAVQLAPSQPLPNVVSTRLPTAVKATEDPMSGQLLSDLATMKTDPAAFENNVNLIREYPNFVSRARNTDKRAEDFIQHVKDNLLYLYDQVPEATRNRSRLWYEGARNIVDRWGNEYTQPDQAISGVLAVLSPQKDWFMNVSLGNRVLDIALNQRTTAWAPEMDAMAAQIWTKPQNAPLLAAIRGKTYEQLDGPLERAMWLRTYDQAFNPADHRIVTPEGEFADVRMTQSGNPYRVAWGSLNEISKAVSILENPSLENINVMLGDQHKVRNFYNNIYAPNDPRGHVTIDTHAVAAGLMRPLSGNSREVAHNFGSNIKGERGPSNSSITGSQGTYGIYAEAYRRAAAERGVLPREMQSITWEAVRGLFPDTYKTAKNAQQIDGIWLRYRKGQLSLDEARNEVIRAAGGINPPEWESSGLRAGGAQEVRNPGDAGELPGPGVSRRGARGPGREQSTPRNSSTVKGAGKAPAKGAE
jgi:hypothetical protein